MKSEKEVNWFVRKYIENDKNFPLFIKHISPYNLTKIVRKCLEKMEFTWENE